jgi:hypothetical protein
MYGVWAEIPFACYAVPCSYFEIGTELYKPDSNTELPYGTQEID